MQAKEDTTIPALQQQLRDCEKGIENILNAIQIGILTVSTKERLEQLEQQRETLKASILQAQIARPQYSKEQIVHWISRFKYGSINDKAYQREIIDVFVNSVYVYNDKLVLTYNFKDGTQTITLKEIEDALSSDMNCVAPPEMKKRRPEGRRFFLLKARGSNPLKCDMPGVYCKKADQKVVFSI